MNYRYIIIERRMRSIPSLKAVRLRCTYCSINIDIEKIARKAVVDVRFFQSINIQAIIPANIYSFFTIEISVSNHRERLRKSWISRKRYETDDWLKLFWVQLKIIYGKLRGFLMFRIIWSGRLTKFEIWLFC